jgi:hypothetical protein
MCLWGKVSRAALLCGRAWDCRRTPARRGVGHATEMAWPMVIVVSALALIGPMTHSLPRCGSGH